MFNFNHDYLAKLFGLTEELEGMNLSFKDKSIESKYNEVKIKKTPELLVTHYLLS